MSCTKHFLGLHWEHHSWRRRVTATNTVTVLEPDMWARDAYRDYVRCEKEDVCDVCGTTRHRASCVCDPALAERCQIRLECLAQSPQAAP